MIKKNKVVSFLSAWPPIKGHSPYAVAISQKLSKYVNINFIGFKNIYPEFLYLGGTKEQNIKIPHFKNVELHNIISWYNPFSWILAGFKLKGRILHAQWWSHILGPVFFVVFLIAKMKKMKIVITVHNVAPHENKLIYRIFDRLVIFRADFFVVHSDSIKKDLADKFKISFDRISVIPHGIIPSALNDEITKEVARKKLDIPYDAKVLLSFGNIREYKALDVLIEAFAELLKKDNSYRLIIAGSVWNDWGKYQSIIDKYNLGKYVVLRLEYVSNENVEVLFKASDLLILSYKTFDAQSGVSGLGVFYRVPILVSNKTGLVDYALNDELILESVSVESIVHCVDVFFDGGCEKIESKDFDKMSEIFGWESIAKKTYVFYEKITD